MSQALKGRPTGAKTTESIDTRIVEAVADAKGVEPLDLDERLYDVVDCDALSQLFSTSGTDVTPVRGRITFTLDSCQVTVYDDLSVDVGTPSNATAD